MRYDVTKLSLSQEEQVIEFGHLPSENGLAVKMSFHVQIRYFDPKTDPLSISVISKQRKIFHFQNFETSR